jgi:hypothetical protein
MDIFYHQLLDIKEGTQGQVPRPSKKVPVACRIRQVTGTFIHFSL